jgi:CDP-diacylglycerol--glycerol-3-phosphate 3-phosphatidyltransferase
MIYNSEIEKDDLQIDNLPNRLTMLRILLIPVVIALLYIANNNVESLTAYSADYKSQLGWAAAWIFTVASITDFFDGYIARRRNIVTVLGSFLDPIADKFLTVSSLIMLQSLGRIHAFIVIVLVLREMYMTSLRLLAMNEGVVVPVSNIGKWKTAIQMIGIPCLMANETWMQIPFPLIGSSLIYIACILSLWSAISYTFSMITKLKVKRSKKKKQKALKKQLKQKLKARKKQGK